MLAWRGKGDDQEPLGGAEGPRLSVVRDKPVLANVLACALCVAAGLPVAGLGFQLGGTPALSLSAGVAVAALLLGRTNLWPGVFLGLFLSGLFERDMGSGIAPALSAAIAGLFQALVAVKVLERMARGREPFADVTGVFAFLLSLILAATLGAAITLSARLVFFQAPVPDIPGFLALEWGRQVAGMAVAAPLLLGLAEGRQELLRAWRLAEAVCAGLLLWLACRVAFGLLSLPGPWRLLNQPEVLIPLFLWVAVRFRLLGAAAALSLGTLTAFSAAFQDLGFTSGLALEQRVLASQLLALFAGLSTYLLVALLTERDGARASLLSQNETLQERVAERTAVVQASLDAWQQEAESRQEMLWELAAAEEKLSLILEQATEGILLVDAQSGLVVEANRVALERLGHGREAMLHLHLAELLAVDCREDAEQHLERVRAEGFDRFETRLRSKDGVIREVILGMRRAFLREREFFITTFSDITELKRSERRLAESEQKHRQLVENLQEGIWTIDANGHTGFVNARIAQMLGYSREEMLGKHVLHFVLPDDLERARQFMAQRALRRSENFELGFLRRDGGVLSAHVAASPLSEGGRHAGTVLGIMDIAYLKQIETHLRQSEQRLMQVIDLVPHMLFARDSRGRFLMANRAMAEALGRPVDGIVGHGLGEFPALAERSAAILAEDQAIIAAESTKFVPQEPFDTVTGEERVLQTTKLPFTQVGSQEKAVLGISIDITEQRRTEQLMAGRNLILELVARGVPLRLLLDELLRLYESLFPELRTSILLLDRRRQCLGLGISPSLPAPFLQALDGLPVDEGMGCCGHAAFTGQLVEIEDAVNHPYMQNLQSLRSEHGIGSCWSMPIFSAEGHVLGTLAAYRAQPGQGTAQELSVMRNLAQLAAIAIDRHERELNTRKLTLAVENSASMIMITDTGHRIEYANARLCAFYGQSQEALLGRDSALFRAADTEAEHYEAIWAQIRAGGDWHGEVRVQDADGQAYWLMASVSTVYEDDGSPRYHVFVAEDISAIKEAHEEMQQLAFHDALTGLENRRLFRERLEHALHASQRSGKPAALLFLDLDKFKSINDGLGHEIGDRLLKEVATRLVACVRQEDCVARLGGDEFTVLLREAEGEEAAAVVAQKIIETLAEPMVLDGHTVQTGTSVGIALLPRDGQDSNSLLKHADEAMYQAKSEGRGCYRFYQPDGRAA
ncbi:MAG: PAS domain S-box protein [Gammaproteobacteria bacterium]|nr:PAS domain S-box protein [Gammaproteobacteria bacterium]